MLAAIKKWLKDNVTTEVEWEGEKARLWTPWTKNKNDQIDHIIRWLDHNIDEAHTIADDARK